MRKMEEWYGEAGSGADRALSYKYTFKIIE